MDVIESIKQDKAYVKFKVIVKKWEKDFKVKYNRTPSKMDIKEAPVKIKHAYKKYFQLKSAALDSTLNLGDDFEMDHTDSFEMLPLDNTIADSPKTDQLLETLPTGQQLEQLLSNTKTIEKQAVAPKLSEKSSAGPYDNNLTKKLFNGKKFSIRNPRKSFLSKSQISEDKIETQSSQEHSQTLNISSFDDQMTEEDHQLLSVSNIIEKNTFNHNKVRNINESWLNRASSFNGSNMFHQVVNNYNSQSQEILENKNESIILDADSNVKQNEKINDYIENSESEADDPSITTLKPALKKKKLSHNVSLTYTNNFNESNNSINITKSNEPIEIVNKKTKKRTKKPVEEVIDTSVNPPEVTDYLPFGLDSEVTPRHTDIKSAINNISQSQETGKKRLTDKENKSSKLEQKVKSGTLNENFVRINIDKKIYARGKKQFNYSKYKKKLNKDKKALHGGMEFPEGGKVLCFKCGLPGHMSRYCGAHKGDTLLPLENYKEEEMLTLDDMDKVVAQASQQPVDSSPETIFESIFTPSSVPESFMKLLSANETNENTDIRPIYSSFPTDTPDEVMKALKLFGHDSFRSGQKEAIIRILSGLSTLLVLSTGGGKSLCYQIPAYIYSQHFKCTTLVISPLVSLMEDQVNTMPEFLKAGCLHTNQSPTQRQKILKLIKDGEINILLISPETLISKDSSSGATGLFKSLPPIAFACIDEAHCVSQWSHNFRPSYLLLCRILREKLNVKCILGLTATASQSTIRSVIEHINVPDGLTGVITNPAVPENLLLSVSYEKDKDRALISLISSKDMESFDSIIVYCIRRDECERIAAILRSSLQEPGKQSMEKMSKKRKRMSYIAEAYHAGMSAAQRRKIQDNFMNGTLRIIVATVAFGMGINKSNIRSIIHYNMPNSFESYVQEIGRAGRDGQPARCHVFMTNNNNDKDELLKHIHSDTVDRQTIRKLLEKVFIPCDCKKKQQDVDKNMKTKCKGHEVAIPIDETVSELDLAQENIATLLCYLELNSSNNIKVLNNAYTTCKIMSYGGPQKILEAAKNCPPLAMAYVLESKKNDNVVKQGVFEFDVINAAASVGWDSGVAKYQLKNLEWITQAGSVRKSPLKVEFNTLGFRLKAPGDLGATELDNVLDNLHHTVLSQEKTMLKQLEEVNNVLRRIGAESFDTIDDEKLLEKSYELKTVIRNYFVRESKCDSDLELEERPLDEDRVRSDVRALVESYKDCSFTGRSIARIFQGISSPNYPALVWGRCRFWRAHLHEDFYGLMRVASQQIIQMRY